MLPRLTNFLEGGHRLSDTQSGFRKDRRCADNHFVLSEVIASRRESSLPTYVAFIDIKKAYDSVWKEGLLSAIARADVRGPLADLIKAMLSRVKRKARIDADFSDSFDVGRGVPQGGVLSPILYDVFINTLLSELNSSGLGIPFQSGRISNLAFADDIALLEGTPQGLNDLLNIVYRHSQQWRYSVNPHKSAVMFAGTKAQERAALAQRFFLGDQLLPFDQDYVYLGVGSCVLRGSPSDFIHNRVAAASAKLHMLSGAIGARFGGISPASSLQLWRSLILPSIDWSCEITSPSPSVLKKVDAIQPAALRVFAGVDSFTPNEALVAEFGCQSLSSRREELQLRFFKHLCLSPPDHLLGSVFRLRCSEVVHEVAPRSICATYKDVLLKYELDEVWESLPSEPTDELWKSWDSVIHERIVRADTARRQEVLLSRPSLSVFCSLKPLSFRSVPRYLSLHGLGPWLKLRLRTNSLPLLDMLSRYAKDDLPLNASICRLCSSDAVEDVIHFLAVCPALQPERAAFTLKLRGDEEFWSLPEAASFFDRWRDGDASQRSRMLLCSIEVPCDPWEIAVWKRDRWARLQDDLISRFESLSLSFLVCIWRRRATLLGGVPCLNMAGSALTISQLRDDGRCRSFAVGVNHS